MRDAALRFPAEWEPQSAVLIAWPHAGTDWAERLVEVEATYAALVAAVTRFQPIVIVVPDAAVQTHAESLLRARSVDLARVRFETAPYDDTWLRDSGPITLIDARTPSTRIPSPRPRGEGGRRPDEGQHAFILLDFCFTAWGGKFEASQDDQLVEALSTQGVFGNTPRQRIEFALEGGGIETDGDGTLLTTWHCLHERHPTLSRAELTEKLAGWLQQDRVLWLDHGALEGDDTDAHIDTLARFAPGNAIVFQACDDAADSHYADLKAMADDIAALRSKDGQPYRLFPLPWAKPVLDAGRRLAASYANYLIINGAVLMPAYGDANDAGAAAVLARAYPGREIVQVPCRALIWQNGSLHCITMQLPQGLV